MIELQTATGEVRRISERQALAHLRAERLRLEQEGLRLRKQRTALNVEIDANAQRLADVNFGLELLGGGR